MGSKLKCDRHLAAREPETHSLTSKVKDYSCYSVLGLGNINFPELTAALSFYVAVTFRFLVFFASKIT
jgi:hypothetical protein